VLEVNPRASRTVPFVSKAIGVPMARAAALLAAGRTLRSLNLPPERDPIDFFIKAPVFPFRKFPGEDTLLGPEMKSTGEVMAISPRFGDAFAKACEAVGTRLPTSGRAFLTVNPYDKRNLIPIARELADLKFELCATEGTAAALAAAGLRAQRVFKVNEGHPNAVDRMEAGEIQLIINTPLGGLSHYDEAAIRAAALRLGIPCLTTLSASAAAVEGIRSRQEEATAVGSLQEYYRT
jgi:carbamoyl-phosphate synthase large subunit